MEELDEKQLRKEIEHIFESGENEIRILEMVKLFIKLRYTENKEVKEIAIGFSGYCYKNENSSLPNSELFDQFIQERYQ